VIITKESLRKQERVVAKASQRQLPKLSLRGAVETKAISATKSKAKKLFGDKEKKAT